MTVRSLRPQATFASRQSVLGQHSRRPQPSQSAAVSALHVPVGVRWTRLWVGGWVGVCGVGGWGWGVWGVWGVCGVGGWEGGCVGGRRGWLAVRLVSSFFVQSELRAKGRL